MGKFATRNNRRVRGPALAKSTRAGCHQAGQRTCDQAVACASELWSPLQSTWLLQHLSEPRSEFSIPAGKPVAGAMVFAQRDRRRTDSPRGPAGSSAARPMARAARSGCTCRDPLQEFLVVAPGFGKQRIRIDPERRGGNSARSGGPIRRSLECSRQPADPGRDRSGLHARGRISRARGKAGLAEVACDASGRFEIPAIAAGMLTLELVFDPAAGTGLRTEPYQGIVLAAGKTTELTIPLRPTVRITGSIPRAGVKPANRRCSGGPERDVRRRPFRGDRCRGQVPGLHRARELPALWLAAESAWPILRTQCLERSSPAACHRGNRRARLPTIELPRGVDVPGTVVDESGHEVAGATVEATWRHGTVSTQLVMSSSDAQGHFVLHGVDPVAELTYRAWLGNSCTPAGTAVQAAAALTKPVVLTITPSASSTLYGRVLDTAGRPISDATVRIWRLGRGKDRRVDRS